MSIVQGMGPCLIPVENGLPCSGQIQEGEPVGSVVTPFGGAVLGHKRCADAYLRRKQHEQREAVHASMVKRQDQIGPGGVLGPERDALEGGIPLAEQVAKAEAKPEPVNDSVQVDRVNTEMAKSEEWTPEEMAQLRDFQLSLKSKRPKPVTMEALHERLLKVERVLDLSDE